MKGNASLQSPILSQVYFSAKLLEFLALRNWLRFIACKSAGVAGPTESPVDFSKLSIPQEVSTMKLQNRLSSLVALIMVFCLVALPVSALGKKGKDHYDRGMKYEQAQQWEKAAQEFTMAIAADPHNVDYQLHYRRAVFNA